MPVDKKFTLLQVTKNTAKRLKKQQHNPRESYDHIINRLVDEYEEIKVPTKLLDEVIHDKKFIDGLCDALERRSIKLK